MTLRHVFIESRAKAIRLSVPFGSVLKRPGVLEVI